MPEIEAKSFYPAPKLIDVVPGEGMSRKIAVTTSKGEYECLPLTPKLALRLARNLLAYLHDIEHFQAMGEGPQ